jgi:hypothetical protein
MNKRQKKKLKKKDLSFRAKKVLFFKSGEYSRPSSLVEMDKDGFTINFLK